MMNLENKQFGNYKLVKLVGKGGMAEVWLADQLNLHRQVAIKVMSDVSEDNDNSERFSREAQMLAQLDHPAILPVLDYGQTDGYFYLVTPFVRGGSLQKRFERQVLSQPEILRLFGSLLPGLEYAHQQGIIHRDLKPGNILLYPDGRAVIADFGIAKVQTEEVNLTKTGFIVGSPEYMAPEQFMGQAGYQSDLYALGVMLFQLLTGKLPYTGSSSVEIGMRHLNEPIPLPHPQVPAPLEAFLLKALDKNPARRFGSVGEMEKAFQVALVALRWGEASDDLDQLETGIEEVLAAELALVSGPFSATAEGKGLVGVAQSEHTLHLPARTPASATFSHQKLIEPPSVKISAPLEASETSSQSIPQKEEAPKISAKKSAKLDWLVGLGLGLVVLLGLTAGLILALSGNSQNSGHQHEALATAAPAKNGDSVTPVTNPENITTRPTLTFPINQANGTQVRGNGLITDNGDGTVEVTLKISGLTPGIHFTHIHQGSCQAQGAIKYSLTNLQATESGEAVSSTTVRVDFATLTRGDMYVNVHNEVGSPTYVAGCGTIFT